MSRPTRPLLIVAAAFVLAGGWIHLREWLDTYRDVPSEAPGSWVVRIGFPVNAAVSVLLAAALVFVAFRGGRRLGLAVIGATVLFQAGSLAALIITRVDELFGWTEPTWTDGAEQTRAVEIGALVALVAAAVVSLVLSNRSSGASSSDR